MLILGNPQQDEREDEELEVIFEASIKRQSLKRRLKDCLDEYKRIVKLLGARGREQEAIEANLKLREVCSAKSDSLLSVPLPWPVLRHYKRFGGEKCFSYSFLALNSLTIGLEISINEC